MSAVAWFAALVFAHAPSAPPLVVVPMTHAAAVAPAGPNFEPDIAAFEASDARSPPGPGAVVFVGSSSIRLWDSLASDFPDVRVLNRGFGGSRLRDVTQYADRIVLNYAPRAIVIYAGDNDLNEGRTPERVAEDFRAFVTHVRAKSPDLSIVCIAIKPSPARIALLPAMRDTNARVRAIAASSGRVTFVDVFTPMLGADGTPRAELFGPDALHLDADGYALWRRLLAPVIARIAHSPR
jgi:lysophospholipase L1-like esterase